MLGAIAEQWGLWVAAIRAARGDQSWWRSPFVWALITSGAAFGCYSAEGALVVALTTPLFLIAGLLWMAVMVLLANRGPDLIAGFVLGVVVLAVLMRIFLAFARYFD